MGVQMRTEYARWRVEIVAGYSLSNRFKPAPKTSPEDRRCRFLGNASKMHQLRAALLMHEGQVGKSATILRNSVAGVGFEPTTFGL